MPGRTEEKVILYPVIQHGIMNIIVNLYYPHDIEPAGCVDTGHNLFFFCQHATEFQQFGLHVSGFLFVKLQYQLRGGKGFGGVLTGIIVNETAETGITGNAKGSFSISRLIRSRNPFNNW
jgi:hypothetical protein